MSIRSLLGAKQIRRTDVICVTVAVLCLSYLWQNYERYDLTLSRQLPLAAPWLVQADKQGGLCVVDDEKTRILKIVDGQITQRISGAESGERFSCAEDLFIADDGDIFVQDTKWGESGFSLDYERILRFDAAGRFQEVCYLVTYDDGYYDKHRLFGMTVRDGTLYFAAADEVGFSLNSVDLAKQQFAVVAAYEMADAITLIQDFVIDPEYLDVYAIDKRGRICRASGDEGTVTELYRVETDPAIPDGQKVALYHAGMGRDRTIYVTDIAANQLCSFSADRGYQRDVVLEGSQMWNVSCQELADGRELLTYVADGQVCRAETDGSGITSADRYVKSDGYGMRELLFDLAAAVFLLVSGYLVLRGAFIVFTLSYSNTQKIGVLVIATVIVVSVILVYGLMAQFKDIYRDELLTKLSMTTQIVSNSIDQERLDQIELPQNYMNDSYQELWREVDVVLDRRYPYSKDIYCNVLRYDGKQGYAVIYLDNSIGTFYPLTDEETEGVRAVYEQGITLQSDVRIETGSYIYVMTPIFGEDKQVTGVVSVGTMSSVIDGKIRHMTENIVIAMIMIILVIMFLFSEVLSFFDLKDKYREAAAGGAPAVPMHVVRFTIFITFMAFNMETSFLPVYVLQFVHEGIGIPTALANSLPITVNLIFVGLTSIFCSRLVGNVGLARLAALSALIALGGDLLMACSSSYVMILAGLMLNGIGVGLITNSIHIFIASVSRNEEYGDGFSIFNAASISGINCGMLFGSSLAARLGQNRVFFISAMTWGLIALIFIVVGGHLVTANAAQPKDEADRWGMPAFILSPRVLKFMVCIQIPYIVMNSFTYYYVPIYGSEHHLTERVISLLIIASSLCSVYLSVAVTGWLDRKFGSRAMYLSGLITFAGLLFFAWKMSLPSLLAALLLIGLANSFGSSTRIAYFLGIPESVRYGEEHAMGAYNLADNLGESTGSVIFAGIISIGFRSGILGLIGCVGGLSAVYALTEKRTGRVTGIP